ncbi:F-box/kelch-repeat protein At3g23880-like [Ipomoea triloba]|uniref:F-box/kelch-repeat protein At3g23880-like n=1 Tax=Ipomoea triloba TaxID=35885 RepID=UPI00125D7A72|nr:F-box/kelch-repeat protein At3g23880-like [Ipomoea triloba]
MEASTPFSNIHNEIIRHILLQLPMKAVIRCQCVCKQWRSWIDDSDFKLSYRGKRRVIIVSHEPKNQDYNWNSRFLVRSTSHGSCFQRHKLPFGEAAYPLIRASNEFPVRSLCSCNGFVLLLLIAERYILLWNPFTRCLTKVLQLPYPKESNIVILGGLCYVSCTRDYKAVILIRPLIGPDREFGYPFVIFASLNHKEWRPVQFPYNLNSANGNVEFRNTFYWWASDIKDWDYDCDFISGGDRNRILYFDPVCDEFRVLPTPELRQNVSIVGLGVIDDCLSMACMFYTQEKLKTMQILIMKEYGIQESWMTAFAIQMPQYPQTTRYPHYCEGYGITFYSQRNNAEEVLFMRTLCCFWGQVYVYDRKKDELREVLMDFLKDDSGRIRCLCLCFYVESLASLPCSHI